MKFILKKFIKLIEFNRIKYSNVYFIGIETIRINAVFPIPKMSFGKKILIAYFMCKFSLGKKEIILTIDLAITTRSSGIMNYRIKAWVIFQSVPK